MSDEEYKPRQKPVLTKEQKTDLSKRNRMSHKRPNFRRQNWFRYKRLGQKWRRPRGIHSKMRRHFKYRIPVVQAGFRGPASVRGLHPSGFEEVLVYNPKNLEDVDPKAQAIRISSKVGDKKRETIVQKADELKIRVLNREIYEFIISKKSCCYSSKMRCKSRLD